MVGAWEQAWRAVEMFTTGRCRSHQRVNVIAVLMDDNIDQMEPLVEMARRRGAYFMVQPYGSLKTRSAAYVHNDGPVAPRLLALHARYRNFLSNPGYLRQFDRYLQGGVPGCKAGRAFFNIDETGDIAICVEKRERPVANLYRDHITVIRQRLAAAARGNACTGCWYNCRGEVESLYRPWSFLYSARTSVPDLGKVRDGRRLAGV
jgi:MoaA/NifB/PqqE/SkfB family radical SAM enzyme